MYDSCVWQCEIVSIFICKARDGTLSHRLLYLDLINCFICYIIPLKNIDGTLFSLYLVGVHLHKIMNAHGFHPVSFPPQTPVDAGCCVLCLLRLSLCSHACKQLVESCVSATCLCWREMRSITGQGCYPGAWAQPCTVISSHLPLFYDRPLREGPSNYLPLKNTALPLHT